MEILTGFVLVLGIALPFINIMKPDSWKQFSFKRPSGGFHFSAQEGHEGQ